LEGMESQWMYQKKRMVIVFKKKDLSNMLGTR